ncbi:hypothetical protein [Leptospira bandrabouensis]|uniref:hypothetical protein n=1 Tax=Leptospira bandrabouensis TaxID=2484903 RepID=UPI00223DEC4F|nr:hypothetical protein [Leptospira bandrabouensis]
MAKTANLRWDPHDKVFQYENIIDELKTVVEIPESKGKYFGFRLDEVPEKRTPTSTLKIVRKEDDQEFTEVLGIPGPLQFFSNYHEPPWDRDGVIHLPASQVGKVFKCSYEGMGSTNSYENQKYIQETVFEDLFEQFIESAFEVNEAIPNKIKNINTKDVSWNGVTVHLNAGVYQIRNLLIQSTVQLRSTDSNSEAIIEVLGTTTFAPGASLEVFKVKLIFLGPVTGDATTPGIIKSPNGANGGAGGSGIYSGGGGGGGGAGGGGGGGAAGGSGFIPPAGGAGGAASLGGAGGALGDLSGSNGSSGSNAITEMGGGLAGSNGSNGTTGGAGGAGGNGSIGAGGGGGGFGSGVGASGGNGGVASEQLWVSAGGNAGPGGDGGGTNSGGGGGGGGGVWIKALFLSSVSNLIIRTGKGGVGGNAVDDTRRGAGGQSGSVRIYLKKDMITNLTVDVSAGTSTGNSKRDGTAGEIHVHDITTGQKTTVWPATWSLTQDRRANLLAFLNESGYHTKQAVNSL